MLELGFIKLISSTYSTFHSRPYWRCYFSNTDAIIYVVDSMDRERIGISKTELVSMLEVSYKLELKKKLKIK